ncbi:MAG: 50S ribosomal protein L25/general stress protein Ctc [Psychrobacter sp.]|uniref:50S ribosomal protein L25/general stress protein Ctc n=1 Tax=Psychrobacter sp. TaxID=56811 RepID=UPI002649288A|nr:50S ribosomal protein L25/general stress protein Ctc [Psychrobacter sp.]MDN6276207.1 50S ribosomal protein L25/general stress protein Ctc [Psychrobacter sp.]MDN6308553.1 50S ribosomal protein L25/general stress protein Ctc [Psychrobacter sp.]
MSTNHFELSAVNRSAEQQGKGASRRLRKQKLVPAIIYGGNEEPTSISIKINELVKSLEFEAFFSHVLTLNVEGEEHQVVIKDLQRHPAKGFPMHADFQRIVKGQKIHMNVPVHFSGRENAPGTAAGGVLSTLVSDIEIICIPSLIPEYLDVDVSSMEIGDLFRLSDIDLPEGVVIYELELEDGHDRTIVNMQPPTVEEVDDEDAEEVDAADVPATEQNADAESKDDE